MDGEEDDLINMSDPQWPVFLTAAEVEYMFYFKQLFIKLPLAPYLLIPVEGITYSALYSGLIG